MLKKAYQLAKISPIAYYFAEFVNRKKKDENVALAAALVSLSAASGNVCLNLTTVSNSVLFKDDDFDGLEIPSLKDWKVSLNKHDWVLEKDFPSVLVLDNNNLYLGKYWNFEQHLASNILARIRQPINVNKPQLIKGLLHYFPPTGLEVDWQAVAASVAVQNGFSVISGGPGTGKTTTVLKVLALLLEQNNQLNIALCAPTGKAAARLSESIKKGLSALPAKIQSLIPQEAKTIHRLLKVNGLTGKFKHDAKNPIMLDVLLVDEVSMVNLTLMAKLLDAIPLTTKVILLGDKDQLPSVETGCVLADITGRERVINHSQSFINKHVFSSSSDNNKQGVDENGTFEGLGLDGEAIQNVVVELKHSYRFGNDSGIGQLARLVNAKKGNRALHDVLKNENFADGVWHDVIKNAEQTNVVEIAVGHYQKMATQNNVMDAMTAFDTFRVLCAVRSGMCGVDALNLQIKQKLLDSNFIDDKEMYSSMPIMISQNDYESGLFNGDTGLLWTDETGLLAAYFPEQDGLKKVPLSRLPEFELAYALTVHKSQGSEFDHVLLCLPDYANDNISKELIYTGITRAKSKLTLVAEAQSFIKACSVSNTRESGLSALLGW